MLKRIKVSEVRTGMYVKEMVGSWLSHPFWKSSFTVDSRDMVTKLRESGVAELWIDTERGLDVARAAQPEAEATVIERPPEVPAGPGDIVAPVQVHPAEEAVRAAQIRDKGRRVVQGIMSDVRLGKINTDDAMELVGDISESVMRSPDAFLTVTRLKSKDEYTYLHSVAVCALMVALARQLDFPPDLARVAGLAGLLHDIGKIAVPEDVLNKPGSLTDAEFTIIKSHPVAGARLLRDGGLSNEEVLDVVLHHHERIDGLGYPDGLKGGEISTLARMGAICDVYDAVTSDRAYKRRWEPADSIKRMAGWSNTQFDDRIFKSFVKCIGIYPLGSLVRLSSERLGVVTRQGAESLLMPEVKVFFSIRSASRITPEILDLSRSHERIVSQEDPERWGLGNIDQLWMEG